MLFKNSFCTNSICGPSRAVILTGKHSHINGFRRNGNKFNGDQQTFPKLLQKAGYSTAMIGKWHLSSDPQGFDEWKILFGQGEYYNPRFKTPNGPTRVEGYCTDLVTDMAIDWMKQDRDKPFCLMLGHKAPHSFYFPEPKYEHTFDDVEVNYPHSSFELDDKPEWITQRLNTWHGIYGPLFDWRKEFPDDSAKAVVDFARMVRAYWGTILSVDDSVGRMRAYLESIGQLDNTVLIFTSDNGLLEGEHGMVDKRTAHEASIRIPIVVRYPELAGGKARSIDEQVLTVDIAPTLIELAGAKPLTETHGRSMVKMLDTGDSQWRTSWFYHYNYEKQFPYTPNVRSIRTDRWKLIRYPHGDGSPDRHMAELYDLQNDLAEHNNLIDAPEHKELVARLTAELDDLMAKTGIETDTMPMDEGIKGELPDKAIR